MWGSVELSGFPFVNFSGGSVMFISGNGDLNLICDVHQRSCPSLRVFRQPPRAYPGWSAYERCVPFQSISSCSFFLTKDKS